MTTASKTTYKGNSPGKALVRVVAWMKIRSIAKHFRIPFQGALVLAGEGGDLGVLEGLGFDMKKVCAVDRDPFMVEWCKHHYPDVIPGTGELKDIAVNSGLAYNTAHIDLCGGIRKADNILTVARVAQGLHSHPAVIAVTMLKGREGIARRGLMEDVPRRTRRRLFLKARKKGNLLAEHVYSGKPFNSNEMLEVVRQRMLKRIDRSPEDWSEIVKKAGGLTPLGKGLQRSIILHHAVEYLWEAWGGDHCGVKMDLPPGERLHMQQVGLMAYQSGTGKKKGLPFVTATYLVYRTSQMPHVQQFVRGGSDADILYEVISLQEGLEAIKPTIASMARVHDHGKVATMFGIDVKSIPAILAHDTRGSYADPMWKARRVSISESSHRLGWGGERMPDRELTHHKQQLADSIIQWVEQGNNVKDFPVPEGPWPLGG